MKILKVFGLLITVGAVIVGMGLSAHVHSERWKVKTLADSFEVNLPPISTTIPDQSALPEPNVGESVARLPSEKTLYTLDARLIEVKKEFDGDYHLVLEDPRTKLRMVAEIPDTSTPAPLADRMDYAAAREEIDRIAGQPGFFARKLPMPPMIEITGIGFFDEPHILTPDGTAPNGREIHPVLRVKPIK